MPATTANFSIRLPQETKDKIDTLARAMGRPRNYLIAEAIERYIQQESWQIAEIPKRLSFALNKYLAAPAFTCSAASE